MNQNEIKIALLKSKTDFKSCIESLNDEAFRYKSSIEKWNAAEQLFHLITSAKSSTLPYQLPSFVVQFLFGKVSRKACSIDELEQLYKSKLNIGAKATGKYASVEEVNYMNKESLIIQFEKTYDTFIQSFEKCSEKKLDICRVPHPILGKISLRELAYFTIFHTQHHIESIQKMNNDK
ncbi:MAG: DinB family protein [Bacteroidota bacterium]